MGVCPKIDIVNIPLLAAATDPVDEQGRAGGVQSFPAPIVFMTEEDKAKATFRGLLNELYAKVKFGYGYTAEDVEAVRVVWERLYGR